MLYHSVVADSIKAKDLSYRYRYTDSTLKAENVALVVRTGQRVSE